MSSSVVLILRFASDEAMRRWLEKAFFSGLLPTAADPDEVVDLREYDDRHERESAYTYEMYDDDEETA